MLKGISIEKLSWKMLSEAHVCAVNKFSKLMEGKGKTNSHVYLSFFKYQSVEWNCQAFLTAHLLCAKYAQN